MCLCATPWVEEVGWVYIRRSEEVLTTSGGLMCFQHKSCVVGVRFYF